MFVSKLHYEEAELDALKEGVSIELLRRLPEVPTASRSTRLTRDHLCKVCPEWKLQQKVLWAEVQKQTGRWKSRWKIRDLLADKRCGKAPLDFLTATDVGRRGATCGRRRRRQPDVRMGPPGAPGAGRGTRGGGGGTGCCGRLGRWGGTTAVLAHALLHGIGRRGVGGRGALSFISFPLLSSLGASTLSWDRPGRRAKGELATGRHCADCVQENRAKCTPP